jgi:hypothetical protein
MLPVLIETPGKDLDGAIANRLDYILDVPRLSNRVLEALLRKRRVLAIVDSLSEKPDEVALLSARLPARKIRMHWS